MPARPPNNRIKADRSAGGDDEADRSVSDRQPARRFQAAVVAEKPGRLDLRGTGISDSVAAGRAHAVAVFVLNGQQNHRSVGAVAAAKKDFEGQKQFAPFWKLYIGDNPLSETAKTPQLEELKKYGTRVHLTYPQ